LQLASAVSCKHKNGDTELWAVQLFGVSHQECSQVFSNNSLPVANRQVAPDPLLSSSASPACEGVLSKQPPQPPQCPSRVPAICQQRLWLLTQITMLLLFQCCCSSAGAAHVSHLPHHHPLHNAQHDLAREPCRKGGDC
jgi:hypothetical protein